MYANYLCKISIKKIKYWIESDDRVSTISIARKLDKAQKTFGMIETRLNTKSKKAWCMLTQKNPSESNLYLRIATKSIHSWGGWLMVMYNGSLTTTSSESYRCRIERSCENDGQGRINSFVMSMVRLVGY